MKLSSWPRRGARQSPWGVGSGTAGEWQDIGQRYEIHLKDGMGTVRTFGWTEDIAVAKKMKAIIDANPVWTFLRCRDRALKKDVGL